MIERTRSARGFRRRPLVVTALAVCLSVQSSNDAMADDEPSPQLDEPAAIEPPGPVVRPTLKNINQRKWVRFGGHYWRLWGGAQTGSQPKGVSVSPDGQHVFVTNFGQRHKKNVYRYDVATLTEQARGHFQGNAIESLVSPDSASLYISNFRYQEMLQLDTTTLAVTRRFKVGKTPKHFAFTPDGKTMYVSNWADATVSAVDMASGEQTAVIEVGKKPRGAGVTHDGKTLYIANFGSHTISVIDVASNEVRKTIKSCRKARHLDITDDDQYVLVACYARREVVVIETATDEIIRRIPVGDGPKTLEISSDQRFAYVADYKGSSMSIIDLQTWKSRVLPMPLVKTCGLAVSHDDRKIYLTGFDSVSMLVVERVSPGQTPLELGPKHPRKHCYRADKANCDKFP